MSVRRK